MRVGFGFDVHGLVQERPLMLGGTRIPFDRGLAGHSDGDVVCHALTDAILGGAALGDIGQHFPSNDPRWKDAPSLTFVRHAAHLLGGVGLRVETIDVTVVCSEPSIAPHRGPMRAALADALGLAVESVSVKATSTDGFGFTGRGEGIACFAVATLASTA